VTRSKDVRDAFANDFNERALKYIHDSMFTYEWCELMSRTKL